MISSAIWNKQALVNFFQRPQIALALRVRAILLVLFSLAYLFQIALEIMWLPIQIEPLLSEVQVLFCFVFFF